jgi:DNA-binding transcriptional ArsR family regulator
MCLDHAAEKGIQRARECPGRFAHAQRAHCTPAGGFRMVFVCSAGRRLREEKPVDKRRCDTVWLHIMRNRSFTYNAGAAFSALADPTRRAVLDLLRRGRLPAGRIAQAFPVSRPAVSKHLRLLSNARLVRAQRVGRQRFFELNPAPLKLVDSWLGQYRVFWQSELANLKSFVETTHAKETASRRVKRSRKK